MAVTQQFNLDMIPQTIPVIIPVNQYDTGTGRLIIKLYKDLNEYTPSSATVKIQGTKPDRKGFQYDATISGNTVTANLTEQMTAVAGDVRTQIVVTESSGQTGTFVFILRVQKSALQDDVDISETVLPEYISGAQTAAIQAEQSAQNAATSANYAETWALRSPYIDSQTSHWMVFDYWEGDWVDSGVSADGSTTSYNSLLNKPTIGGEEVSGNKYLWDYGLDAYLENINSEVKDKVDQSIGWEINNMFNYQDVEIGKDYDGSTNSARARIIIPLNNNASYFLSALNYDEEESPVGVSYSLSNSPTQWDLSWFESPEDFGGWNYLLILFRKNNITYQDIASLQMMLQLEADYKVSHSQFIPYNEPVKKKLENLFTFSNGGIVLNT